MMQNNEEFKRVKVSFNFDKQTKDLLDSLKSKGYSNTSELVNKIMKFDFESMEEYVKIANIIHNSDKKFNKINIPNGAIILNHESAMKLDALDLTNDLRDFNAAIINTYNKKDDNAFKELEKYVNDCLRSTGALIKEYYFVEKQNKELMQRVSALEEQMKNSKNS
jgi:hypothetical protein